MQQTIVLEIKGMTCSGCARHVTKALQGVSGVEGVMLPGWEAGRAQVRVAAGVTPERLVEAVAQAGYRAGVVDVRAAGRPPAPASQGDGASTYDLAILGGGSAAFAAALKASELGGRVVIVNDGLPIGGTCVNVGCVPSKALIRAAEQVHRAARSPFDGIATTARVADFAAVTGQVRTLVQALRQHKYVDVAAADPNVTILEGRGRLAAPGVVEVNGRVLRAKNVLIATGARTAVPPIPGLDTVEVLTNETVFGLDTLPAHLIVIGGGYIGVETAQAFRRLGSEVTVVDLLPRILDLAGEELSGGLQAYLEAEGIRFVLEARVQQVRREGAGVLVAVETGGRRHELRGSHLFLATGRRGNTEDLGLEALGIATDRAGFLQVDDSLRTAVPTVFGAGDVIGGEMFVYTAAYEGSLAAENALKGYHLRRDYTALPWVVFTDPQVAGVGMDEREAGAAGLPYEVARLPLDQVPRALAARDTRGFVKLIRHAETDVLLGARILAPEGGELLMELALAVRYGIPVRELAAAFHPYLTLSEAVKLAAITFGKDVSKLSCCAA
ncbi:MAG: mercuric reductase [Rhodothermaceae bacterium]|nr:MAG: mercuric reductase [Rhodothermaceae bacterium]